MSIEMNNNELNYQYASLEWLTATSDAARSQALTTMEYLEEKIITDEDRANDLFDQVSDMIKGLGTAIEEYSQPELYDMVLKLN